MHLHWPRPVAPPVMHPPAPASAVVATRPDASAAALRFPFPEPPRIGATLTVAEGLEWLRMPLPFALDHINLWVLRDGDGVTLVDTGFNDDTTRGAWERVLAGQPPAARLIATHYHPDHLGLAGWLTQRLNIGLWTTQGEFLTAHAVWDAAAGYDAEALVALFRAHGLLGDRLEAVSDRGNHYRRTVSPLPRAYRRLCDGETFAVDGRQWQVMVGTGHAPEHAALYCASLGVLISGDMLLPRISTNTSVWSIEPEGDPVGQFLASIRRFTALPDDTLVLPAHGLPFRGIAARVAALEAHHAERLAELLEASRAAPLTAFEVLPVLFRRPLDNHQLFFAMGEAIGHLNHLLRHGALSRQRDASGVYRFRAA
jgi:glyoxylase-like metal-dependent hydrolase (beta-lactamase superfamily II)